MVLYLKSLEHICSLMGPKGNLVWACWAKTKNWLIWCRWQPRGQGRICMCFFFSFLLLLHLIVYQFPLRSRRVHTLFCQRGLGVAWCVLSSEPNGCCTALFSHSFIHITNLAQRSPHFHHGEGWGVGGLIWQLLIPPEASHTLSSCSRESLCCVFAAPVVSSEAPWVNVRERKLSHI